MIAEQLHTKDNTGEAVSFLVAMMTHYDQDRLLHKMLKPTTLFSFTLPLLLHPALPFQSEEEQRLMYPEAEHLCSAVLRLKNARATFGLPSLVSRALQHTAILDAGGVAEDVLGTWWRFRGPHHGCAPGAIRAHKGCGHITG